MSKRKEDWRQFVEMLVRVGAPHDMVKRFEVLTRHFFRNAEQGFWPLTKSARCDAIFAAAVISKLTGSKVDSIRFVGRNDRSHVNLGHGIGDYLIEGHCNRLLEILGEWDHVRLSMVNARTQTSRKLAMVMDSIGPENVGTNGHLTVLYLAGAAAAEDRKLFDALGSIAVAMQDMIPLGEDREDPGTWFVLAG
ncbi:MAG: hypothetical protein U9Q03_04680 [Patescibacteria group bacterium]|nr:hypothetical protein [Patescibacteria group bacterium]